ncbi:LysR family transcriptional regulator [Mesorhizobium sp. B4-1-4]|uniref:LysR family transcriptional regulator n=1 Tax=Mesorhizobium sp. B4-1-4 TaxID=2589888 RepID=UPI001128FA08|nr:LysR substrate-binding domain-containing protein [Mesorhizobium sp. B4-1-4]UCI31701.1 LysR family transcriptional regulator [Mesorhizobium sp. B4-1-4]
MPRSLPPLSYLRPFEATARLGSVKRAAEELGRTHGAISKQLQLLQEQLGFSLFEKVGTGIRLNGPGEALFATVSQAFDLLEERYGELKASRDEMHVHITCSATFAMVWLVPRLAEFYRHHPNCRVQLSMGSSSYDSASRHSRDAIDLSLSWDRLSRPTVDRKAVPLGPVSFGLVSAPDYPLQTEGNRFSFATRISHDRMDKEWLSWQTVTGNEVITGSEIRFPHMHLCLGAAAAGLGVALTERRFAVNELRSGKLVERSPFLKIEDGFVALVNPARKTSKATVNFLNWLRDAFAEELN